MASIGTAVYFQQYATLNFCARFAVCCSKIATAEQLENQKLRPYQNSAAGHDHDSHIVINQYFYAPRTIILGDTIEKISLNFGNERIVSRMFDNFHTNEGICFPLMTQYLSNAAIFEWPNNVFYCGQIRTGQSVANQLVTDRSMSFETPGRFF